MRRALAAVVVVMSMLGLALVATGPTHAAVGRDLTVSGTGVEMYPAFSPAIDRYAATTTDATAGTVDVAPTPGPGETVTINGGSATHLTGLNPGDLITVAFTGGSAPRSYTVMYLPSGFPKLTVTTGAQGAFPALAPGLVAVTLFPYGGLNLPPAYDAIVDRNGVPVYAREVSTSDFVLRDWDLKQQPTGEITVQRPAGGTSYTNYSMTVLDPLHGFQETTHKSVAAPLTNTDFHDSLRLRDGSTILIGYEPNAITHMTDATIQKVDAAGDTTFSWTSAPYASETMAGSNFLGSSGDYAHINSVTSVENGDIIASFRHLSSVYRIATVDHGPYHAGDVIWKLGGRDSTFTFVNDPFPSGPCAQHAVSELPNGHILLYDNGTNTLCVDPANPLGPGINRGSTRISEYALDTVAGTATLVWSYQPAGKYSLFAGSARRMSNGDTLIGWASDASALATEVSADGQKLWELTVPDGGPGVSRYISYRAELITALAPTATLTGPADNATVVAGDRVPAGATCQDWLGNALDDCAVTGLVGQALDTSTPGAHTWQVVAQDGAGNTTTATRHYTVRPPGRQPDGLVRKAGSTVWKGSDVYGGATDQTVRQRIRRSHTRSAYWQVQNDGERADTFRLVAAGSNRRVRVHYFADGVDVTRAVVGGTYVTPTLGAGGTVTLTVTLTPTRRATVGDTRTVTMAAVSVGDASRVDRVATVVTVRR